MKTNVYYYIFISIFVTGVLSFILSCDKEKETPLPPTNRLSIETDSVKSVLYHTAIAYGSVGELKNITVQQYGHCWDTIAIPTIDSKKTVFNNLSSQSKFTSNLVDLKPAKKYYVRSYAKTASLTAYSEISSINTKALEPPTLTSDSTVSVTSTATIVWGTVKLDGGTTITARGVCWGANANPTVAGQYVVSSNQSNSFSSQITGLTRKTTYHARVYATNTNGTAYGNDITFTTLAELPILTTTVVSGITAYTATSGGNISSDGSSTITERGVCWSLAQNPTLVDSHSSDGNGSGVFISNITGLQAGKTYYVKAYAKNSIGTVFGNQVNFTTPIVLPTVTTTAVSEIKATTATGGGNVTDDGGSTITARGVCWSNSHNPTIANFVTSVTGTTGIFISNLSGLINNTTYYVRAFATNTIGTGYGTEVSCTTQNGVITLSTISVSSITSTTAISGGNITSDGGASIISSGVCWNTSSNPIVTDNHTTDGVALGVYSSSLVGLTLGDTYYVRAYATNSVGTFYGNQLSFKTKLVIGDNYQGGIVAYIFQIGEPGYVTGETHGLIVTPTAQSAGLQWYNGSYLGTGATGTALGTGQANTTAIVTTQGVGNYAAKLCDDLVLGGYSDWYLPSKDELNKLYLSKDVIGGFGVEGYWSSSEYNTTWAWYQSGAYQGYGGKGAASYVRAIRSF